MLEVPVLEKNLLQTLCNLPIGNEKCPQLLSLIRKAKDAGFFQNAVVTESINLFFNAKENAEGVIVVKYYLEKIASSLVEKPSLTLDEVIGQLRLSMKSFITSSLVDKVNEVTFSASPIASTQVAKLVEAYKRDLENLEQVSHRVYNLGEEIEIVSETKLPSPIPKLVNYFAPKRFYLIAGFPGEGKTHFLTNLGVFWYKKGYKVLHLTLEIPLQELLARYLACYNQRPIDDISTYLSEEAKKFQSASTGKMSLVESIDATPFFIDNLLAEAHYDFVLVDYLDLLRSGGPTTDNLFLEYLNISKDLYQIAKRRDTAIVAASQLNRAGELSRSFGKQETTDGLVILRRTGLSTLRLSVEKLRHGEDKKAGFVDIDYSRGYIDFNSLRVDAPAGSHPKQEMNTTFALE
jgi:KaiC/GvpD/RAD55 family RecA-like ATPase